MKKRDTDMYSSKNQLLNRKNAGAGDSLGRPKPPKYKTLVPNDISPKDGKQREKRTENRKVRPLRSQSLAVLSRW